MIKDPLSAFQYIRSRLFWDTIEAAGQHGQALPGPWRGVALLTKEGAAPCLARNCLWCRLLGYGYGFN